MCVHSVEGIHYIKLTLFIAHI